MTKPTCHICLQPLENGEELYHTACCKKLFGSTKPPAFPYAWEELNKLAEQIITQHITIPGVQPKLSMHLEKGGRTRDARLTLVGLEGGYILKPPVAEYPEMPELEHVTMRMAGCFGIATAECGLIPMDDGQLAFITKRMDRIGDNKLHMEDMCQLTDKLTEQKYRGSMEQIGKAIIQHCDNGVRLGNLQKGVLMGPAGQRTAKNRWRLGGGHRWTMHYADTCTNKEKPRYH